jgi:hypothetical protein
MAKHDIDPVLHLARRRVSGAVARKVAVMETHAVPGMKSNVAVGRGPQE